MSDLDRNANGIITGSFGGPRSHAQLLRAALAWEFIERGGGAHPFLDAAAIQIEPLRLLNDKRTPLRTLARMLDALRLCEYSLELDWRDGAPVRLPRELVGLPP